MFLTSLTCPGTSPSLNMYGLESAAWCYRWTPIQSRRDDIMVERSESLDSKSRRDGLMSGLAGMVMRHGFSHCKSIRDERMRAVRSEQFFNWCMLLINRCGYHKAGPTGLCSRHPYVSYHNAVPSGTNDFLHVATHFARTNALGSK